jgi:peptidoglycan/LPS O-acetylase OafA/YrhL
VNRSPTNAVREALPLPLASRAQAYRPQIDTLRALAVTAVLISHLLVPFGGAHHGVRLFFVISGFLITGILLKQRDDHSQPLKAKLATFYIRRSIRIWPIFYLTLLIAAVFNFTNIRDSLIWHLTYLSNIYYLRVGEWDPAVAGHLWSLAVEEQFYLVWPFIILLVPPKRLPWVLGACIAIAITYRWGTSFTSLALSELAADLGPDIGTPAAFDALGIGAALALAKHAQVPDNVLLSLVKLFVAVACLAIVALTLLPASTSLAFTWLDFFFALIFGAMVFAADRGVRPRFKRLVEYPPVLYIGRISYGIYLYHLFVKHVVDRLAEMAGWDFPNRGPLTFLVVGGATLAAASLSWFAIERPLARWKQRFGYAAGRKPGPVSPAAVEG